MARTLRLPALFIVCALYATLDAGDGTAPPSHSLFTVAWGDEDHALAVCAGAENWLLSIVPDSVPLGAPSDRRVTILAGERTIFASVLHVDPSHRLCLIESDGPIPGAVPLEIAEHAEAKAGTNFYCVASGEKCRTALAGKDRVYLGKTLRQPLLRVRVEDAENFCSPGTPLIDSEGRLAGILTARKLQSEGEAHAIPSTQLRKLVSDFKLHRRSGPVWIGMVLHDQSTTPEIIEVRPDSPAEEAGLAKGDVVLEVGGSEVKHIEALTEAVYGLSAGVETTIKVLRQLEPVEVRLVPEFAVGVSDAAP